MAKDPGKGCQALPAKTMPRSRYAGRSFRSTFDGTERWWRSEIFPRHWYFVDSNGTGAVPDEPEKGPLVVKSVDLNIDSNTISHHTNEYEITQDDVLRKEPRQLVVRRGQTFTIALTLDREKEKRVDKIRLLWEIGDYPAVSKGTSINIKAKKRLKDRHWSAAVQSDDGKTIVVEVLTPADCIIGKWRLTVETVFKLNGGERKIRKDQQMHHVYIIFNPWCKDDQVYMADDVDRDEYVMNEDGKIFSGSSRQIASKPWEFSQFQDIVLDCSLYLLDKVDLSQSVRGSPVDVTRAVSAVVNSQDDNGVLVGNWSGDYAGGTRPTAWTGSLEILTQYYQTKQPVLYGQCWVFSGVTTTVCRALGIPTRSVTNFSSAHDCDGSITIDSYWDLKGEPIESMNRDSVWNFHVWNESWMTRPDLTETRYGGWQAFDATPQETSGGIYCAGPFPLKALRDGYVNMPYDGKFIFAEVNADRIDWIVGEDGQFRPSIRTRSGVGKSISTKRPDGGPEPPSRWRWTQEDPQRLDVTDIYKHKEGTEEERAAVYRANTWSSKPGVYNFGKDDVQFEITQRDHILVGSPFDVVLHCQNKSRQLRTIHATVTLSTTYYTGVYKAKVKQHTFDVELKPIKAEDCIMRIAAEEYLHLIVEQVSFKISALCTVKETNQVTAVDEVFRLRRPDLALEAPSKVKLGEDFTCKIKLANSMPVHLTQSSWMVESPGIQRPVTFKQDDIEPYDIVEKVVTLTPKRRGKKKITASFSSKELMDVTGSCDVEVE